MKLQIVSIAVLTSLLLWGGSYFFFRNSYQALQAHGVIPNLHVRERVGLE